MPVLEWQRIWILKDEKEYEYKALFNNDTTKSDRRLWFDNHKYKYFLRSWVDFAINKTCQL